MKRQICIGLSVLLILCSQLQFSNSLPSTAVEDAQVKDTHKDAKHKEEAVKSDLELEASKRGWKDNTMQVWGKRIDKLLGETDSKISQDDSRVNKFHHATNIKRKWGQNNMPVWGKRAARDRSNMLIRESDLLSEDFADKEKRKWGTNSMTVWGKRGDARDESIGEYNKRKWGENSMTVWGKRAEDFAHFSSPTHLESKRKWGDNSMNVWGKRSISDSSFYNSDVELQNQLSDAEKRKWSDNTMQVWGKRDGAASKSASHHSISKRSLRSSESYYDDLVDSELLRYLNKNSDRSFAMSKRSWETNTMPVWGKRSKFYNVLRSDADLRTDEYPSSLYAYRLAGYGEPEKRAWSSDNELRVWG